MTKTPVFRPWTLNPLIEETTAETLFQVQCCLAFISRVHADLSDWEAQSKPSGISGPDDLTWEQHRGLHLMTECVRAAVLYELDRPHDQREGRA